MILTPKVAHEPDDWHGYFVKMAVDGPALPPRSRPCADCAVVCEMEADLSDALAEETAAIRDAVSERWFCHETPGLSCAGNRERVAMRLARHHQLGAFLATPYAGRQPVKK